MPRQALTTVEALVSVIELPHDVRPLMGDTANGIDAVAANAGSNRFIVGASVSPKTIESTDALAVTLQRDGKQLHATTGADVLGGQAQNLMALINQIIDEGHVLHRGDIIICGALGGAKPGEKAATRRTSVNWARSSSSSSNPFLRSPPVPSGFLSSARRLKFAGWERQMKSLDGAAK
ncbi:MAG: hypothetical protein ABIZ49_03385 [Opitutaceae bacterium]